MATVPRFIVALPAAKVTLSRKFSLSFFSSKSFGVSFGKRLLATASTELCTIVVLSASAFGFKAAVSSMTKFTACRDKLVCSLIALFSVTGEETSSIKMACDSVQKSSPLSSTTVSAKGSREESSEYDSRNPRSVQNPIFIASLSSGDLASRSDQ